MDLRSLTIDSARSAIADGKTSATALAGAFYAKIESDDPKIGPGRSTRGKNTIEPVFCGLFLIFWSKPISPDCELI